LRAATDNVELTNGQMVKLQRSTDEKDIAVTKVVVVSTVEAAPVTPEWAPTPAMLGPR
jgi:hypothetical protein